MNTTIVLFGATGDLAQKKLFPTLLEISANPGFEQVIRIIAIGRREYSQPEFLDLVRTNVTGKKISDENWQKFSESLLYYQMDFSKDSAYAGLRSTLEKLEEIHGGCNRLFYLSVPPQYYPTILTAISASKLHEQSEGKWRRIVVEKPFGHNEQTARDLNDSIAKSFSEDQVYRIDHYLAKETVQNILAFRFANGIFEPLWNKEHIDHIQITVAESEGIKTRGTFYDSTGAFRDLVQNHIIQLLSILTMEEPVEFTYTALSDEKAKILHRLSYDPKHTFFGQYTGYTSEPNINPDSQTETFAATRFLIDSNRWNGVPVYIRTGKNLAERISEISIIFKESSQHLFVTDSKKANILTFRLQPDEGISLQLAVKTPRENMQVQTVQMEFCYATAFHTNLPDAYERLFYDILRGDNTLFLREDTIEKSWHIVDEILAEKSRHPLLSYTVGSWGPTEVDDMLSQEGRHWLAHESAVCNGITVDPIN